MFIIEKKDINNDYFWLTWYCTHFLKIGLVVAGSRFYSYYIHQGNKSDKEKEIVRKEILCIQNDLIHFKNMGVIPCGCNPTSTIFFCIFVTCDILSRFNCITLFSIKGGQEGQLSNSDLR